MGPQLSAPDIEKNKQISFTIHGKRHHGSYAQRPGQKITPETSLLTYLRDVALLKDTKAMCREGGCGACIVTITVTHPRTGRNTTMAVNSCLVPVLSCHNWTITTVHGLGNRNIGYHPIQTALAKHNGTQCGFCTPGMAMNMLALTESKAILTMEEIENSFGGNICRCTGYRPIINAFKSLAHDADPALKNKFPDIEDLRICQKKERLCEGRCPTESIQPFYLDLGDDLYWYKVYTLPDILIFFKNIGNDKYRLVAGNTAQGIYKITDPPKYWLDIRSVKELVAYKVDNKDNLVLGANMSISDTIDLMRKLAEEENRKFWYLQQMWDHLDLVAHIPVRNIGTLAGNLSTKHDHHEFPSDIFLLFETVGAEITIGDPEYGIPSAMPFKYQDVDFNAPGLKISLVNVTIHGAENIKVVDPQIDLDNNLIKFSFECPMIIWEGDYTADVKTPSKIYQKNGHVKLNFAHGKFLMTYQFELEYKNGTEYGKIILAREEALSVDLNIQANNDANGLADEEWNVLKKYIINEDFLLVCAKAVALFIQAIFNVVPYNDIFPL